MKKERPVAPSKKPQESKDESKVFVFITILVLGGMLIITSYFFGLAYLDKEREVAKAYKDAAVIVKDYTQQMDSTINEIHKTNIRYNLVLDSVGNKKSDYE